MFENKSQKFSLPLQADEPAAEADIVSLLGAAGDKHWEEKGEEGELSVDVSETEEELIIVATMAGTEPDKIELHLHNDLLTIRGERQSPAAPQSDRHCEENYWGRFSRTIVLPKDVKPELCRAEYKNGLLVIRLTKVQADRNIPIFVIEE